MKHRLLNILNTLPSTDPLAHSTLARTLLLFHSEREIHLNLRIFHRPNVGVLCLLSRDPPRTKQGACYSLWLPFGKYFVCHKTCFVFHFVTFFAVPLFHFEGLEVFDLELLMFDWRIIDRNL